MVSAERRWVDWHAPYDDPESPLSRRLACVQRLIGSWLAARRPEQRRIVSVCAGQGRDVLEVLAGRADVADLEVTLVELDPENVAVARQLADAVAARVEVVRGDAGVLSTYERVGPADLLLVCGVFGNVSDDDVARTVAALPMLCGRDATVLWTRHRRAPDLTPSIRQWFDDAGFVETAFVAPEDAGWSVGAHRLARAPSPRAADAVLFTFV